MPISRLRLQLSAYFALVFLLGLGVADFARFSRLRRGADESLSRELSGTADGLAHGVARELADLRSGLTDAAREAIDEWPPDSNGFAVYDSSGAIVASRAPGRLARL